MFPHTLQFHCTAPASITPCKIDKVGSEMTQLLKLSNLGGLMWRFCESDGAEFRLTEINIGEGHSPKQLKTTTQSFC